MLTFSKHCELPASSESRSECTAMQEAVGLLERWPGAITHFMRWRQRNWLPAANGDSQTAIHTALAAFGLRAHCAGFHFTKIKKESSLRLTVCLAFKAAVALIPPSAMAMRTDSGALSRRHLVSTCATLSIREQNSYARDFCETFSSS